MGRELFELELFGGAMERRYRKARPEVEAMPWGTLDASGFPDSLVTAARKSWTRAAFQEHRTGCACALTVKALIEARAPLDLIALATRFPLDEVVHVELCSRMAMELGGATPIVHDPDKLVVEPQNHLDPVVRCADLVVRFFCVGEALSIPMLRGTWRKLKPGGLFFSRLGSTIGVEGLVRRIEGRRYWSPDGSERYLVDAELLGEWVQRLGAELADPLKTTVVDGLRAMTTWVMWKR